MNRKQMSILFATALLLSAGRGLQLEAADGWGSVSGQFIIDGEVPKPVILKMKGAAKDKCCRAADIISDDLTVDPKTKGIANIFIYMYKKPSKIHKDLLKPKKAEVVFDQKGCRFLPPALIIRTDQKLLLKSADACAHNTNAQALFRNKPFNILIPPLNRKGFPVLLKTAERLPTRIECNLHSWMKAFWLIVDHPYAVKTDKQGKFKIENVPTGNFEFVVWRFKYVSSDYKGKNIKPFKTPTGIVKGFSATIETDKDTSIGVVKIKAANIKDRQ